MCKKLTQEVFTRTDCPAWAKWAAVDFNGTAYFFEAKPECNLESREWFTSIMGYRFTELPGYFDSTDWKDSVIKRPETNLEWLCEHPEELAKKLTRFDYRKGAWLAPDGTEFYPRIDSCFEHIFRPLRDGSRCYEYTVNWLKQEHKENNNDQKQS